MCTRKLDGRAVEFGTTGYTLDSVFVLYDRDSDSVWYPLGDKTMDAVAGDRRGDSIPFLDKPSPQTLADWLALHPDSTVMLPSEADTERIQAMFGRPYMGVQLEDTDDGLRIAEVVEGSGAADAGLLGDDLIVSMDGQPIANSDDLRAVLGEHEIDDVIAVVVLRDGEKLTLDLTLGSRER